ncbi:MAG: methyl-accepting chemotaxis protein, partial [Pseudomonadota bacterium]
QVAEFNDNLDEIDAQLASALALPYLSDSEAELLRALADGSAATREAFANAREERLHEATLYTTSAEAGDRTRDALTELIKAANRTGNGPQTFDAATAQEGLLLSRVFLERFLLVGDEGAYEQGMAALDVTVQKLAWIGAMAQDPSVSGAVETAQARLADFAKAAKALHDSHVRMGDLSAALDEQAFGMLADTEAMVATLSASRAGLSDRMHATNATVVWSLALGAAASIAFAMLAMRATVRTVTHEFDVTLDAVGALSHGDFDVDITGADRDTELGRIAKALLVFRDNGLEAKRLASEADAAKRAEEERQKRAEAQEAAAQQDRADAERRAADARKKEIFDTLRTAVSGVVAAAVGGDFSRRVSTAALEPELAGLAEDINQLMTNVDRGLAEISQVSGRLAQGDLTEGMTGRFEGTFHALQQNIGSMIGELSGLMADIATEAQLVQRNASDMTEASEDLARRAETQAASLEETSAAMTEIAASADSNAKSAARTDADANEMRDAASTARKVLDATISAMGDIQDGSREIEAIVDVIEDIAFQTNLLSLNASVEAARAGEAGKGFAVVANEVRALAQRSAEASSQVQQIITQSTGAISRGSDSVSETGAALERILERVERVSASLREIRSASEEQATAVKDVTNGIAQLDKITQRNAAAAEESRGTSALLSTQSQRMRAGLGRLKLSGMAATAATEMPEGQPHSAAA